MTIRFVGTRVCIVVSYVATVEEETTRKIGDKILCTNLELTDKSSVDRSTSTEECELLHIIMYIVLYSGPTIFAG